LTGGPVQGAGTSAGGTSKGAKPIFLNFFQEAKLGSVAVKETPDADRAIVREVYQKKFYLGWNACPKGGRAGNAAVANVQTVKSPAVEGQLLHLVTIVSGGCSPEPEYAREDSAFLVISENGRVLTKTATGGKDGIAKVFNLGPEGPAGVVVVGGCFLCQGDTTMDGWIYEIGSDSIRELQALGTVYDSDCGGSGDSGERGAIFRLESASPFQLSQKNYQRTCEAAESKEKTFKLIGKGKMK
jgi:hypothetical protein